MINTVVTRDQVIALAGVVQALSLVEQLAKTGYLKTDEFRCCVSSLFVNHPDNTEQVFGSISRLTAGAERLEKLFSSLRASHNTDTLRYFFGVMHLQKKLKRKQDVLSIIGNRLEKIERQTEHFDLTHDNVVGNIADIYTDTISKFRYRIQVTGEFSYLQQTRIAQQIRALLLAAIRAMTLWDQLGGKRWQLVLSHSKIHHASHDLFQEAKHARSIEETHSSKDSVTKTRDTDEQRMVRQEARTEDLETKTNEIEKPSITNKSSTEETEK